MIVRLLDFLHIRRGVVLVDCWGSPRWTFIYRTFRGIPRCHVYPFAGVGEVGLLPDGTTSGESSYISEWEYMSKRGKTA